MKIIKAVKEDKDKIMDVIKKCVKHMEDGGLYQWNDKYPNDEDVLNDIQNQNLYIAICEGEYAGVITINNDYPNEYNSVKWITSSNKFMVVHRLAVNPKFQGKGIGSKLMYFTEKLAKQNQCEAIRLDTYSVNKGALGLYYKLGYIKTGEVHFDTAELSFHCLEKSL